MLRFAPSRLWLIKKVWSLVTSLFLIPKYRFPEKLDIVELVALCVLGKKSNAYACVPRENAPSITSTISFENKLCFIRCK